MSYLRAVMRRLDPWAALLLGVLLALGVVILLATPGPWQRVVGKEPPVRLETPAPEDVAIFVLGGRAGSCTGIVWLHLDPTQNALSAVVVAPRVSGFAPADGAAPLADVVDAAGARAGAAALGRALGVNMDAWVTLDRRSLELVVQPMFPMNDVRAARTRYREARAAWRGRGGLERAWATQYDTLRVALPRVAFSELGVVAFSNYVLGFGFVESDLTLEGATSLGEALQEVDPARVSVRAAPVIAERCRGGEVWRLDASRVEPLRQSLAFGLTPPETGDLVTQRTRPARVLVVAPLPRGGAARYAAEVRARLDRSAGAPVEVTLVSGADDRLAFRAARELDARPALIALVAPAPATQRATAAVAKVGAMLQNRGQEAVVAGPLPAPSREAAGSAARKQLETDLVETRLPVSWSPVAVQPDAGGAALRYGLEDAARANVQTLVRAGWPGTLAPDLRSTRLGFVFVAARHTSVGVVTASDERSAVVLGRLRLWGFVGERLTLEDSGWRPDRLGPAIYYRPGARAAAAALAGDLGVPPRSVFSSDDSPREVVFVTRD